MIYPDTSFLVAARVRRDTFHKTALDYYEAQQMSFDDDQLALAEAVGLKAVRPS
jgi:hypothetical protein